MKWEGSREGLVAQQFLHSHVVVFLPILGVVEDVVHLTGEACNLMSLFAQNAVMNTHVRET